jgi:hypothetical protein
MEEQMKVLRLLASLVVLLAGATDVMASGPLGIYGIVEKVVFEPNEQAPRRIQVWGAFAYVDGTAGESLTISPAARGYLYFRLPADGAEPVTPRQLQAIRREWADLKSVAGTGQAIGFGHWGYIGAFGGLRPDARSNMPPYILERAPGNPETDLRVRPASETPASPALYQTEAGLVKLSATGSHAAVVKQLHDALRR